MCFRIRQYITLDMAAKFQYSYGPKDSEQSDESATATETEPERLESESAFSAPVTSAPYAQPYTTGLHFKLLAGKTCNVESMYSTDIP